MAFEKRVRQLRHAKDWSLRDLAEKVGVGFTYLSRVENERLNFGDYPTEALIHRLADALDADEEELLILAKRIPESVKKRFLQRPDAFRAFAGCDDETLDKLMAEIGQTPTPRKRGSEKNRENHFLLPRLKLEPALSAEWQRGRAFQIRGRTRKQKHKPKWMKE